MQKCSLFRLRQSLAEKQKTYIETLWNLQFYNNMKLSDDYYLAHTGHLVFQDVQYLMYAASDRSLTIYDATTLSHTPLYCITGMPSIPTVRIFI